MTGARIAPRDLAYCGVFGAAALLMPMLFHLVHLGHVFMPMYLPVVALAFFVRPAAAVTTAAILPLLSAVMTGMPPLFPPVAPIMSVELGFEALAISLAASRWPGASPWLVLVPVLVIGRFLYVGLVWACSLAMDLPAGFVAGASLLSGWPGVVLMIVVIPPVVMIQRRVAGRGDGPGRLEQDGDGD